MPPLMLFWYLLSRMIVTIVMLYGALAALIFIADFVENLRFAGKYADGSFVFALQITALRTPGLAQLLTPFIFLFSGLWLFAQLNRRSELSVMRSAGLSIWKLIAPPAMFAAFVGVILIVFVDPAATTMTAFSERMKNDIRGKSTSLVQIFGDGIWLRQRDGDTTLLINADSLNQADAMLSNITVWRLTADSQFVERIDAPSARLVDRTLELQNASVKTPNSKIPRKAPIYLIPTNLSVEDFSEGTPLPETMSLWDLPRYIRIAEAAGLPTVRYNLRFHDLCSTPLKLVAMVMIAAIFSLKPVRSGGAFKLIIAAVAVGFGMYFVTEVAAALGESGAAPPMMAAWAPGVIGLIIAVTGLLHLEEG